MYCPHPNPVSGRVAGQVPSEVTRFGVDGVVSPGVTGTGGAGGCGGPGGSIVVSGGGCGGLGGFTPTTVPDCGVSSGVFGTVTTCPPLFGTCWKGTRDSMVERQKFPLELNMQS